MITFNSWRIVFALLVTTVASGILLTGCGPACGQLCQVDFWHEDEVPKNPSVESVQAELNKGVDVNAEGEDRVQIFSEHHNVNRTPLDFAVRYGSLDVVELLLDHGADPEARGDDRISLLNQLSANLGTIEQAEEKAWLLLNRGADVNSTEHSVSGESSLIRAAEHGENVAFIQVLILYGADVNAETR